MKKLLVTLGGLLVAIHAFGQNNNTTGAGCSCPSCVAKAAGKTLPFTLPGLQELNTGLENTTAPEQGTDDQAHDEHVDCDHDHGTEEVAHDDHEGYDHAAEEAAHDDHEGHDHGSEEAGHDDHGEEGGLELSPEMAEKIGVTVQEAEGGTIAKTVVFPAEIKLNRDRAAAVSPRYASIVRQVLAEIGDVVRKGDVLASLENRETMAVYTVAAPLDGVIISKDLAVGETAGEDEVLFEVADLSSVWADISIFPKYQHFMHKGMPVEFVAHDGHTARGTIRYISPIVSHETRTFTARCVLEGADEDFTPGAFVRARITVETIEAAVVVPRKAIQTLEGETVVFIPGEHAFQTSVVELGLADEHNVEIKRGLHAGDQYVASGAFALKAQMVTRGMDPHAGHGH